MPSTTHVLFDDHYWDHAAAVEDEHRARHAVVEATLPNGVPVWVVLRDAEVRAALSDPRLSKDHTLIKATLVEAQRRAGRDAGLTGMFGDTALFNDGARHRRQRALLQDAVTGHRVRALRPRVEQIATALLDALDTRGPVDLIARFAFQLPIIVICELLGVPGSDRELFRTWTADLM
jgi:cytochrome P450